MKLTRVYCNHGELHTLIGIYVDDDIIVSLLPNYIEEILNYMKTTFKVTSDSMDYFVGFQIQRCSTSGSLFLHQHRYISDILLRFGLQDAHEVSTPHRQPSQN